MRLATAEIAALVHNAPASNHMFPMTKLVDTAHSNVHRVGVIWPLIMPFLIEAATHKVSLGLSISSCNSRLIRAIECNSSKLCS